MALIPMPLHVRRSTPSQSQGCCRDGDTRTHRVVTAVLRSEMGAVASVVARLRAVPDKAKDYKWKEFKAYEGGVLVVRSNRLHKVAAHSRCTGLCATPHAWCKACDRGHWAAPQRALRCAEFRARTHIVAHAMSGYCARYLRAKVPRGLCDCNHRSGQPNSRCGGRGALPADGGRRRRRRRPGASGRRPSPWQGLLRHLRDLSGREESEAHVWLGPERLGG